MLEGDGLPAALAQIPVQRTGWFFAAAKLPGKVDRRVLLAATFGTDKE
jgi:hypothetical protein